MLNQIRYNQLYNIKTLEVLLNTYNNKFQYYKKNCDLWQCYLKYGKMLVCEETFYELDFIEAYSNLQELLEIQQYEKYAQKELEKIKNSKIISDIIKWLKFNEQVVCEKLAFFITYYLEHTFTNKNEENLILYIVNGKYIYVDKKDFEHIIKLLKTYQTLKNLLT